MTSYMNWELQKHFYFYKSIEKVCLIYQYACVGLSKQMAKTIEKLWLTQVSFKQLVTRKSPVWDDTKSPNKQVTECHCVFQDSSSMPLSADGGQQGCQSGNCGHVSEHDIYSSFIQDLEKSPNLYYSNG